MRSSLLMAGFSVARRYWVYLNLLLQHYAPFGSEWAVPVKILYVSVQKMFGHCHVAIGLAVNNLQP